MVSPNDKGIIPPEEMIDHNNANFSQIENIMTIFVAYNQANIQQGTARVSFRAENDVVTENINSALPNVVAGGLPPQNEEQMENDTPETHQTAFK